MSLFFSACCNLLSHLTCLVIHLSSHLWSNLKEGKIQHKKIKLLTCFQKILKRSIEIVLPHSRLQFVVEEAKLSTINSSVSEKDYDHFRHFLSRVRCMPCKKWLPASSLVTEAIFIIYMALILTVWSKQVSAAHSETLGHSTGSHQWSREILSMDHR